MNVLKIAADMKGSIQDATQNIPKNTDIDITAVLNWVYAFAGLVAAGFIVYGAVNYATAQGDPGKLKQASQTLAFAIIGLIIVLLAAAITNFVAGTASS